MTAAIVLAAGLSSRMGRPKLLLPWGETTVIGRVVEVLWQAGAAPIVVVSGAAHASLQAALSDLAIQVVFNQRYQDDQMILSLQVGLAALSTDIPSSLVVLGDQPQIEPEIVRAVIDAGNKSRSSLVVPSFQMHRGHPWLIKRGLFAEIMAVDPPITLREFLTAHSSDIEYLEVESGSILLDLDTPEDYRLQAPRRPN